MTTTLDLLKRIQTALAANLKFLTPNEKNINEFYRFEYCRFLNNTLETFIFLVSSERVEGSRILIRPALEVTFRLQAIENKPELLLRIAAWEHDERRKLMNGVQPNLSAQTTVSLAANWAATVECYKALFPHHSINETPLSSYDAAKEIEYSPAQKLLNGDRNPFYDTYYRMYGPYTHGHIDGLSGEMDYLSDQDNNVAGYCLLIALHSSVNLGADDSELKVLEPEYTS